MIKQEENGGSIHRIWMRVAKVRTNKLESEK